MPQSLLPREPVLNYCRIDLKCVFLHKAIELYTGFHWSTYKKPKQDFKKQTQLCWAALKGDRHMEGMWKLTGSQELGMWLQDDQEFKASFCYTESSELAWATWSCISENLKPTKPSFFKTVLHLFPYSLCLFVGASACHGAHEEIRRTVWS